MNFGSQYLGIFLILISMLIILWNYVWLFLLKNMVYLSFIGIEREVNSYCLKENIPFKSEPYTLIKNVIKSSENLEAFSFLGLYIYNRLSKNLDRTNYKNEFEIALSNLNEEQNKYFRDVVFKLYMRLTMFLIFRSFIATIIFIILAFILLLKAVVSSIFANIKIGDSIKENMLAFINKTNIVSLLNNSNISGLKI